MPPGNETSAVQNQPQQVIQPIKGPETINLVRQLRFEISKNPNMPFRGIFLPIIHKNINDTYKIFNYSYSDGTIRRGFNGMSNIENIRNGILGHDIKVVSSQSANLINILSDDINLYKNNPNLYQLQQQHNKIKQILGVYTQFLSVEENIYQYRFNRQNLLNALENTQAQFMMDGFDKNKIQGHEVYPLYKKTLNEAMAWGDNEVVNSLQLHAKEYHLSLRKLKNNHNTQNLNQIGLLNIIEAQADYDKLTLTTPENRELYFRHAQNAKQGNLKTVLMHKGDYNPLGWSEQKLNYYDQKINQQCSVIMDDVMRELYFDNSVNKAKKLPSTVSLARSTKWLKQNGYWRQVRMLPQIQQEIATQKMNQMQMKMSPFISQNKLQNFTLPNGQQANIYWLDQNIWEQKSNGNIYTQNQNMQIKLEGFQKREEKILHDYNTVAWQKINELKEKGVDTTKLEMIMRNESKKISVSVNKNNNILNKQKIVPNINLSNLGNKTYMPLASSGYNMGATFIIEGGLSLCFPGMGIRTRQNISQVSAFPLAAGESYLMYKIFVQPTSKISYTSALRVSGSLALEQTKNQVIRGLGSRVVASGGPYVIIVAILGVIFYPSLKAAYDMKQFKKKHNIKDPPPIIQQLNSAVNMHSCDLGDYGFNRFNEKRNDFIDKLSPEEQEEYFDEMFKILDGKK